MAKKKYQQTRMQKLEPIIKKLLIVGLGIYLSVIAVNFSMKLGIKTKSSSQPVKKEAFTSANSSTQNVIKTDPRPKYWFYMARGYMWIFFSVDNVLKKLGLEKIEMKVNIRDSIHNNWDLLWSYDYHNEIPIDFKTLRYHQKINHIPGNFVLCKLIF